VIGIVAPFAAGFVTTSLLLPAASTAAHLFVGATLSATSVGITARVFQDLRRLQSPEARLILSAAVIDDVLGLIVLAVVAGVVAFAAGLIVSDTHFPARSGAGQTLHSVVAPLEQIFAPVFFLLMGMQVNLSTFARPGTLAMAAALTVAAVVGKVLCGLVAGKI